jgi:Glycosyltransferase family 87
MKRAVLTTIAVAAALYAIVVTWRKNERAAGLDFYLYYVNSQLPSRADVDNIYSPETQERIGEEYYARAQSSTSELFKYDAKRRRRLDNVSSPFLYATLRWVSRNYDRALLQDHALLLIAFIAGVLALCRLARVRWCWSLVLLAAMLLWYRGFEADLRVGSVNSLQLAAVAAMLWSPPLLAGAILGLLIAFKPNLILIVVVVFVARLVLRDWHRLRLEVLGGAIGVAIAIVVTAINYGTFRVWLQWVSAANEFFHRLQTRDERNVAPALSLFQQHGTWWSYVIAAILIAIVVYAIVRAKRRDDALLVGLAILIYLISAPVVWLHYMVLALPLAIALLRWRWTAIISLVALAVIAEVPFEWITRKPVYPHDATLITPALLALFACGVWALSKRDKAAA